MYNTKAENKLNATRESMNKKCNWNEQCEINV